VLLSIPQKVDIHTNGHKLLFLCELEFSLRVYKSPPLTHTKLVQSTLSVTVAMSKHTNITNYHSYCITVEDCACHIFNKIKLGLALESVLMER
jgi:hypothetical protein